VKKFCIVFILILSLILISLIAAAQKITLQACVIDSLTGNPLFAANIIINKADCSSLLKGTITNKDGYFYITGLASGRYKISVSYVGYRKHEKVFQVDENPKIDLGRIFLVPEVIQIGQVDIKYKPIVEHVDESNLTLHFDLLGDLGDLSALDVIQSLTGLYVDFNDKIRYDGYTDFTTLIDGKRLGQYFSKGFGTGNIQTYLLKKIPARQIKKVEVLPEPRGKYGFFTPVINMIPTGNLRDFYTVATEAGTKNKFEAGTGVSRVYKKFIISPELKYLNRTFFSDEMEDRKNKINIDQSFSRVNNSTNQSDNKNIGLKSEYHFNDRHNLKLQGDIILKSENQHISQVKSDFFNNNASLFDNRFTDFSNFDGAFNYINSLKLFSVDHLTFKLNSSWNQQIINLNQSISNRNGLDGNLEYRSSNKSRNKGAGLQLNYFRIKPIMNYFFDVDALWEHNFEQGIREYFDSKMNEWKEIGAFSGNQSISRLNGDISFKVLHSFKARRNGHTNKHTINAQVAEDFNVEILDDHLKGIHNRKSFLRTTWGFNYRGILRSYSNLSLSYKRMVRSPDSEQLLELPAYIDQYTMSIGNPGLKQEIMHLINADYTWNSSNSLRISSDSIVPPRYGYSLRIGYRGLNNEIVNSLQYNDDGVRVLTYDNCSRNSMVSINLDSYTFLFSSVKAKLLGTLKFENYPDNSPSIRSGTSWSISGAVDIQLFKQLKIESKYTYQSPGIAYQRNYHGFHTANFMVTKPVFNQKINLSLEIENLLTHQGRKIVYHNNNYQTTIVQIQENPVIWLRASLMMFRFLEKK